jgi:hypothetical protein
VVFTVEKRGLGKTCGKKKRAGSDFGGAARRSIM